MILRRIGLSILFGVASFSAAWGAVAAASSVSDAVFLLGRLPARVREPAVRFALDDSITVDQLEADLKADAAASDDAGLSDADGIRLLKIGWNVEHRGSNEFLFDTAKRLDRLKDELLTSDRVPAELKPALATTFGKAYADLHTELSSRTDEKAQLMAAILRGNLRRPSEAVGEAVPADADAGTPVRRNFMGTLKKPEPAALPYVSSRRFGPDLDEDVRRDADGVLAAVLPVLKGRADSFLSETRVAIRDLSDAPFEPFIYESQLPRAFIEAAAKRGVYVWFDETHNTVAFGERLGADRLPGRTLQLRIDHGSVRHPFTQIFMTSVLRLNKTEKRDDRPGERSISFADSPDRAYLPVSIDDPAIGRRGAPSRSDQRRIAEQMQQRDRERNNMARMVLLLMTIAMAASLFLSTIHW